MVSPVLLDIPILKNLQWDRESCGAVSILKVLRYYGIRATLKSVRRRAGTDRKGHTSASDIIRVLREYHLRVRVYATGTAKISDVRRAIRKGHPVIAYYEDKDHWVVVRGVGSGKVFVSDPSLKGVARELVLVQSTRRFLRRWDRSGIEAWPRKPR